MLDAVPGTQTPGQVPVIGIGEVPDGLHEHWAWPTSSHLRWSVSTEIPVYRIALTASSFQATIALRWRARHCEDSFTSYRFLTSYADVH